MPIIAQASGHLEFRNSQAIAGFLYILSGIVLGGVPMAFLIESISKHEFGSFTFMVSSFTLTGLCICAAGVAKAYARTIVSIDANRLAIVISRRSITSEHNEEHPFQELSEVLFSTETRSRSEGDTYQVWVVDLPLADGPSLVKEPRVS